ncbi:hypothetical protein F5J12DRAFT_783688 [Pisolithus orientalis]|uniref:uncharacterized protein n=1 Tax=Pisolithus orientalis TaxID=936130 RepID=UPI0022255F8D|nr:uncharacterized protein F5J12DRAFT_783688 [Pisolithus orientalis]KAI6003262.1 hypothetical protein F5J12DRAFT_783688 [Pisolithus orientalis]
MWEEKMTWLRHWEERMAEQDVQMEEETTVEVSDEGAAVKMSHEEVPQPAHKMIAESNNDGRPQVSIPPGLVLHAVPCTWCTIKGMPCIRPSGKMCNGCMKMKQGCKESSKAGGRKVQTSALVACATKAPKASLSKWAHNDDSDDIVEVVKGKTCGKGKEPVCGRFNGKTTMDISQALGMVRDEAVAAHVANLHLQVCVEQLSEALVKLGVE